MTKEQIERINALARKAKGEGLTSEEKAEQLTLRELYLQSVRTNLQATLENVRVKDENGGEVKLRKKPLS